MSMRSIGLLAAAGIFAVAAWSQLPTADHPAPDPLQADPRHYRLEFENQWVRVIHEHMGPREVALWHRHPEPGGVVVFLTDQYIHQTLPDGTTRDARHKAGDVIWSPAATHRGENRNDAPFEYVEISPQQTASGAAGGKSLEPVDPQHERVEVENEFLRAVRVIVEPREKIAVRRAAGAGSVILNLTDQHLRQRLTDGKTREKHYKAKQVRWEASSPSHEEENLADTRFELIRIELK